MRYHREMLLGSIIIEVNEIRIIQKPDRLSWYRFVTLAKRLGLKSINIAKLISIYLGVDKIKYKLLKPSYITIKPNKASIRKYGRPYDLTYKLNYDLFF